jgi:putative PIG3 family NAD(P)H quinone oxidoreductase
MENVPQTMTAIGIAEPGGPEVLRPQQMAVPRPARGQVLVRVAFAGVNRPDVLQRMGRYPPPEGASPIPGLEIAGEVVALGEGVRREMLGRRICALVTGGGYAEYCLADARHCLPVPEALSLAEAAAMPETLFTVWHNVFERGYAREGETLLVHGGTSGIGTMAIKLGKLFGLTVIVTCGTDGKCEAALQIGADNAINYRAQDFVEAVRTLTGGKGAEIALEMVAGDYTQRTLDCLGINGRLVTIAVLGGAQASVNMAGLMVKRQTITGSTLRARSDEFKAVVADEIARSVWPSVAAGELRPRMDSEFAMHEAAAAHARMDSGEHIGKIVLSTEAQ